MLLQRIFQASTDADAHTQELKSGGIASPAINGDQTPMIITMRPGAIERWRILNGGVDGQGFARFMVVKGQYDVDEVATPSGSTTSTLVKLRESGEFTPASRAEVSADKQQVYQFAFDGVNLIDIEGKPPPTRFAISPAERRHREPARPPAHREPEPGDAGKSRGLFRRCDGITNAFICPNEVYLATGNRADVFFQAPRLAEGSKADVYTVLSREVVIHSDQFQSPAPERLHQRSASGSGSRISSSPGSWSPRTWTHGAALPSIPDFDVMSMIDILPEVQPYPLPIEDDEVQVGGKRRREADPDAALPDRLGQYRTRTIIYSGWGAGDFPLVTTAGDSDTAANFRAFIERDQDRGGTSSSCATPVSPTLTTTC